MNPNTLIQQRTPAVCRDGALWMEFACGGYMYVLIFHVVPVIILPGMAPPGHRTIMCEYSFLAWLIWLRVLLLYHHLLMLQV